MGFFWISTLLPGINPGSPSRSIHLTFQDPRQITLAWLHWEDSPPFLPPRVRLSTCIPTVPTSVPDPFRIAVFASGGGSNFQSIIDAAEDGWIPADVALCVSDRASAGALERASVAGIPSAVIEPGDDAERFADALLDLLRDHDISFVALAGYLRKIPPRVVEAFRGRMVNIHPSLLPAFGGHGMYGMHVHQAVVDYGVRWTGVTVHLVDEAYDHGPVVLQEPVPVFAGDRPEDVAARVLNVEHRLYPTALRLFASGRVHVDGRTVRFDDVPSLRPATDREPKTTSDSAQAESGS